MTPLCATLSLEKPKNFSFLKNHEELEKQKGREKEIKACQIKYSSKKDRIFLVLQLFPRWRGKKQVHFALDITVNPFLKVNKYLFTFHSTTQIFFHVLAVKFPRTTWIVIFVLEIT